MQTLVGNLRIIESEAMVDEDWSRVRSPGRARRRRAKHRQNIVVTPKREAYVVGNTVYMHPVAANALRAALKAQSIAVDYHPLTR